MEIMVKFILLIIGFGMDATPESAIKITILLVMVTLSAFLELQNTMKSKMTYIIIFLMMMVFYPGVRMYLPLLIYDINFEKRYFNILFLPLLIIHPSWMLVLLCGLAMITKQSFSQMYYWHREYYRLLDQSDSQLADLKATSDLQITLHEQSVMIAINQERSRIAREIHDHVGHVLSSAIIQLGAIEVINQQDDLRQPISKLQVSLSQGMEAIRSSVHHLYDKGFDLEQQLMDLKRSTQMMVSYEMSRMDQLPEHYRYDLYMIIKEAINNAQKHSTGKHVNVKLKIFPDFYQLIIQDDGDVKTSIIHEGVGLKSIQDRVSKWNGSCAILTNQGFKLHIVLPKGEENESTSR